MDPNATYDKMINAAQDTQIDDDSHDHHIALAGAVLDLNDWMQRGGFLPVNWAATQLGIGQVAHLLGLGKDATRSNVLEELNALVALRRSVNIETALTVAPPTVDAEPETPQTRPVDERLSIKVTELRGLVEAGELSHNAAVAKLYNYATIYQLPVSERKAEELIQNGA